MSHDAFFQNSMFNVEEDFKPDLSTLRCGSNDEIEEHLNFLFQYITQRFQTMREIESKIAGANMKQLIVAKEDSLLTVKRKARAFKKLLKEDAIPS